MPTEATINKHAKVLQNCYIDLYIKKYGREPSINTYRDIWGFKGMYNDLGDKRARQIIEFYFSTGRVGHPLSYLLYNYDKLNKVLRELEQDENKRLEIRRQTAQRVAEWEQKVGNG